MGSDEFTVHLISTASMDYFPDNTLASFRNFCKEEIALDGDWRVALSEIIFPTKLNNKIKLTRNLRTSEHPK